MGFAIIFILNGEGTTGDGWAGRVWLAGRGGDRGGEGGGVVGTGGVRSGFGPTYRAEASVIFAVPYYRSGERLELVFSM